MGDKSSMEWLFSLVHLLDETLDVPLHKQVSELSYTVGAQKQVRKSPQDGESIHAVE